MEAFSWSASTRTFFVKSSVLHSDHQQHGSLDFSLLSLRLSLSSFDSELLTPRMTGRFASPLALGPFANHALSPLQACTTDSLLSVSARGLSTRAFSTAVSAVAVNSE